MELIHLSGGPHVLARFGLLLGIGFSLALPLAASAEVTFDWVTVGDPGNACDTQPQQGCFGSVDYVYRISKYEVTNSQYAEFLNAKAVSDPLSLYDPSMGSGFGGITRSGSDGSYTYAAIAGRESKPVNYVSFYDALRFSNWLHNGQGSGDTEAGAYTLLGGTPTPSNGETVARNAGATVFLPNEDEWYKPAYYDAVSEGFFAFPAGSGTWMGCATPGATPNTANCDNAVRDLTDVGSYTGSPSPNGTFDQAGNVYEWNETITSGSFRVIRGGSFYIGPYSQVAASYRYDAVSGALNEFLGFRVASLAPASHVPSLGPLGMALLWVGLAVAELRRIRARLSSADGRG